MSDEDYAIIVEAVNDAWVRFEITGSQRAHVIAALDEVIDMAQPAIG